MLNILLIEDDEVDADAVRRLLECYKKKGMEIRITHATAFGRGMEILKSDGAVNIVLLDMHLPDGEGPPLVRKLRETGRHVPVIVMTGMEIPDELSIELMREGAQDYIPKRDMNEDMLTRSIRHSIERYQLLRRIELQAEELKFINEELETFTYIISHDLRSPLVNLKGFSGELQRAIDAVFALLRGLLPRLPQAEQEVLRKEICQSMPKALHYIVGAAEKMDRLTGAILKLSRMGRREISFEPVNTAEIVNQCLTPLAHQIKETRTVVRVDDLPPVVGDRVAVEQVFGNLLDNALKYLDPSRPGSIRISGRQEPTHCVFAVEDNGRGIHADDMHKVFEIFRRGGDVENIPGDGMGMPYVRSIVRRHKGDVWLDSKPGEGTTVRFSIANKAA